MQFVTLNFEYFDRRKKWIRFEFEFNWRFSIRNFMRRSLGKNCWVNYHWRKSAVDWNHSLHIVSKIIFFCFSFYYASVIFMYNLLSWNSNPTFFPSIRNPSGKKNENLLITNISIRRTLYRASLWTNSRIICRQILRITEKSQIIQTHVLRQNGMYVW